MKDELELGAMQLTDPNAVKAAIKKDAEQMGGDTGTGYKIDIII